MKKINTKRRDEKEFCFADETVDMKKNENLINKMFLVITECAY